MSLKKKESPPNTFLQLHIKKAENIGFWEELYFSTLLKGVESMYQPEIIAQHYIADLVIHGEKVLIKWEKRLRPLTKNELKEIYGKDV